MNNMIYNQCVERRCFGWYFRMEECNLVGLRENYGQALYTEQWQRMNDTMLISHCKSCAISSVKTTNNRDTNYNHRQILLGAENLAK